MMTHFIPSIFETSDGELTPLRWINPPPAPTVTASTSSALQNRPWRPTSASPDTRRFHSGRTTPSGDPQLQGSSPTPPILSGVLPGVLEFTKATPPPTVSSSATKPGDRDPSFPAPPEPRLPDGSSFPMTAPSDPVIPGVPKPYGGGSTSPRRFQTSPRWTHVFPASPQMTSSPSPAFQLPGGGDPISRTATHPDLTTVPNSFLLFSSDPPPRHPRRAQKRQQPLIPKVAPSDPSRMSRPCRAKLPRICGGTAEASSEPLSRGSNPPRLDSIAIELQEEGEASKTDEASSKGQFFYKDVPVCFIVIIGPKENEGDFEARTKKSEEERTMDRELRDASFRSQGRVPGGSVADEALLRILKANRLRSLQVFLRLHYGDIEDQLVI
ncbi:hypothetical protein MLD38_003508 [Melastoma candidum]|uniref:Uncharacterized protein n=1 Tax=Melastoma candidum TaxID=119954 RepID=A0ACB9S216_9MYRT|nr:hypothetical protein MLD38_003508 [Melastoma candidum]